MRDKLPADSFIVFLKTRKTAETREFYESVMQTPVVLEQAGCWIHKITERAYLGFCDREGVPDQPENIVITYVRDDVDECFSHLLAQNIRVDGEPRLNPTYGIYHFFAYDPNGYSVEVQRFESQLDREEFGPQT